MTITRYAMQERQEVHIDALEEEEGLWVYFQDHRLALADARAESTALRAAADALLPWLAAWGRDGHFAAQSLVASLAAYHLDVEDTP